MNFLPGWFPGPTSGVPNPKLRLVNTYAISFGGTASATVTVPAVDLGFPATPTKQILVGIPFEAVSFSSCTINGVAAPFLTTAVGFLYFCSAVYAGAGPFNIVINITATSSEIGKIAVWEIDEAAPVYQACRNAQSNTAGTTKPIPIRVPDQGQAVGIGLALTDTTTQVWTGGLTEDTDQDAGDYALSTAKVTTNSAGKASLAVLDTFSASGSIKNMALAIAPNKVLLQGGPRVQQTSTTVGGPTITFSSLNNFTGLGNFKLILFIQYQDDMTVTDVKFNGVSMALIGSVNNTTPGPDLNLYAYHIDVTQAAPSGNVVVFFSAASIGVAITIHQHLVYNVGSIASVVGGATNTAAGAALAVTVAAEGTILAAHVHDTATDTVSWSGLDISFDGSLGATRGSTGQRIYCDAETNRAVQATASGVASNCTLAFALNP